jgi:hypothetical protein
MVCNPVALAAGIPPACCWVLARMHTGAGLCCPKWRSHGLPWLRLVLHPALGRGMLASVHCGVQCYLPLSGAAHCEGWVQPRGSSVGLCVAGTVALGLCPCLHASCSRNLLHSRLAPSCGRVSRVVGSSSHWQCALGRVWQPVVQQPAVGCCILRCHPWVLFAVVPSTWHWWKFTSGCCRMQHVVWFRLSISVRQVLRVLRSLPTVCMPRL